MEQRGRKSSAALTVISGDGIVTISRPDPDESLTEEQAKEWRDVVNRLPAEWFPRETHGMLVQYCRHVVSARRIATLLAGIEGGRKVDVGSYDQLLKMQEREGRAISSLATRMRISQQSTMSEQKKKPLQFPRKPWDPPAAKS